MAEVGRQWWRAVCGSDLEYGGIVALLGLFIAGKRTVAQRGEWSAEVGSELLFCPPHVSVEALLPTAATDSLRACVVEHGFLVETKVLASCPSLESGSLRSYDDILRRITERQATAAELNTKQFPGHSA